MYRLTGFPTGEGGGGDIRLQCVLSLDMIFWSRHFSLFYKLKSHTDLKEVLVFHSVLMERRIQKNES